MEIAKRIAATQASYIAQRPRNWEHLAEISRERMWKNPSHPPILDVIIYYGAHVAIQEERVLDASLWAGPAEAVRLAYVYGPVLKNAHKASCVEGYAYFMRTLTYHSRAVPSARALIQASRELNLELRLSEEELHSHTVQRPPYFCAHHPLKWLPPPS